MKPITFIIMTTLTVSGLSAKAQNPDFIEMIAYAIKAPSGHNTQPWIFWVNETSIDIYPDFNQSLEIVDPDHRELYISLGCAAENLCLAAANFGYLADFSILKNEAGIVYMKIGLVHGTPNKDPLFHQIEKRQTNRGVYTGSLIPHETLRELESLIHNPGVSLRFFENGSNNFEAMKDFVAEGNAIQMKDRAFKTELIDWMRFNKKQVEKQQNGLTYKAMGMPAAPPAIGKRIVRTFLNPKSQNKADMEKILSSSHLVLFSVDQNEPGSWILLGRSLQRFLLETTSLDIAHAYINQACEVEDVTLALHKYLGMDQEYPSILLRIGYASQQPISPRKDLGKVISFSSENNN